MGRRKRDDEIKVDFKKKRVETEEEYTGPRERLFSKKKMALIVAYDGTGYSGLQIQPDVDTIEKVLEQALYDAKYISDDNRGDFHKTGWARAARTDKGVHALGNVVSLKTDPEIDVEKVNALLPETIRILDAVKTTRKFNAKMGCSSRYYEYWAPSFVLDDLNTPQDLTFRASEVNLDRVQAILNKYVGTSNYHSFTSRKKATDMSANRYIMSFDVSRDLILYEGVEFFRMVVHGQSFMLHQIRKMIGTMIAIFHGLLPEEHLEKDHEFSLFSSKLKYGLPIAPSIGLFLNRCVFTIYNQKLNNLGGDQPPLELEKYEDKFAEFRNKIIRPRICSESAEEYKTWLGVALLDQYWTSSYTLYPTHPKYVAPLPEIAPEDNQAENSKESGDDDE